VAARSVIETFREGARNKRIPSEMFAENVQLFGSLTHKPFQGKDAVIVIIDMLLHVCEDLEYVAERMSDDGVALLVRGRIKDRQFDGAMFFTFNSEGLIIESRDFVRPLSALLALQEAAGQYLTEHAAAT
jgi:hypothetical protein